jgi:hypothetical protein
MKALISPIEEIELPDGKFGYRIAEVVSNDSVFEVAEPLYWIDCPEDCSPDLHCFFDGQIINTPLMTCDPETGFPINPLAQPEEE